MEKINKTRSLSLKSSEIETHLSIMTGERKERVRERERVTLITRTGMKEGHHYWCYRNWKDFNEILWTTSWCQQSIRFSFSGKFSRKNYWLKKK